MASLRLDKLLADMGIASRKELRQIIKSGRVCVNNLVVTVPEQKVDGEKSCITLDGLPLCYTRFHYYMMDKPVGLLSVTEDKKQDTVLSLVTPEMRRMNLFPVGRLDKDTSGLLLLTDDGTFAHRVISPKSHIEKLYDATVDGCLTKEDVDAFAAGLILRDGTQCLPAKLEILSPNHCHVRVMEGKYHQVRRMLASRGTPVLTLRRLSIGGLSLDKNLASGGFRELDQREIELIFLAT